MKWHFSPQLADQVELEVTQRDQFNNDELDISETIVREAVQNSLDAVADEDGSVCVKFRWLDSCTIDSDYFRQLFDGQIEHARKAGLNVDSLDFSKPEALVIEDFGTHGLTGSTKKKDDDNFSDFWRRHGKSHKTGKSRGRWGLGKLVYSVTSQVGVFFGVTSRAKDSTQHLMGQTVLNLREVDGKQYPPHAFFADVEGESLYDRITVPLKDKREVDEFCDNFSIDRRGTTGLSIVIPFPAAGISEDKMINVAIGNYFYPLITGLLTLEFNGLAINAENVRELAKKYAHDRFEQIDVLFDFIEEVYTAEQSKHLELKKSWIDDRKLDEDDFRVEDLEAIREKFETGQLVGVQLPVTVKKQSGDVDSFFSVYIKKPEILERGLDLYVRGGLTLPGEQKFNGRGALGIMVAEDEAVCALLGDAENAAHTKWISNTEKLRKNYINNTVTSALVMAIKRSVVELYDLLSEAVEEKDENALLDFFWFDEPEKEKNKRPKKKKEPKPVPPIESKRQPLFHVSQVAGGFSIHGSESLTVDKLPMQITIKAAYDVAKGNPFKKYSMHDFRAGKGGNIRLKTSWGVKHKSAADNKWVLMINRLPLTVKAIGFDVNRDLKISVK